MHPPAPGNAGDRQRWQAYPRRFASRPALAAEGWTAADIVEWDVVSWAKAVSFWRRHTAGSLAGARVLEVGARDGGLTHWLIHEGASVVSSDLHAPTALARRRHVEYLDAQRVEHVALDATNLEFDREFDVVVFKSVLGSIAGAVGEQGPRDAIDGMHRALKPGGLLLFAENLESSPAHLLLRRRMVAWGAKWHYLSLGEMHELLGGFDRVDFSTAGFLGTLGRSEAQRRWLSKTDSLLLDWTVPRRWNYLIFGVARKAADPAAH